MSLDSHKYESIPF